MIKRLLTLANLAGVVAIGLAVWGFWAHSQTMKTSYETPVFVADVKAPPPYTGRIDAIKMQLGRFPKAVERGPEVPVEKPAEDLGTVLSRLGTITNAIVTYPPYTGVWPTISFELKNPLPNGDKVLVLGLGEALETKPHPRSDLIRVPYRYKFIRCEPDPEHPGWTYFVFDVNCDGKEEQKTRWKLEGEKKDGWKEVSPDSNSGFNPVTSKGVFVGDGSVPPPTKKDIRPAVPAPNAGTTPVVPQPATVLQDDLFDVNKGTFETTREGAEWLKKNYDSLAADVRGSTWRDPKTRRPAGIQVTGIRKGSAANNFGIRKDDVILAVNDRPVTSKDQAMKVVKSELQKPNNHIIRVKVLRLGAQKVLRFDSRDPATRRAARDAMR
ncbi:MAG: PDZ domain-containing protein [Planctomycetota bacterium]|nr:PDZ domain-containing protein [Planctomycetota bacterium]